MTKINIGIAKELDACRAGTITVQTLAATVADKLVALGDTDSAYIALLAKTTDTPTFLKWVDKEFNA